MCVRVRVCGVRVRVCVEGEILNGEHRRRHHHFHESFKTFLGDVLLVGSEDATLGGWVELGVLFDAEAYPRTK